MGDLTNNFSRHEFACKCGCGFNTVDFELLNALQHYADRLKLTSHDKVSAIINCGCRCKKHNDEERELFKSSGGKQGADTAENSQHIFGRAADVKYFIGRDQIPPKEVSEFFSSTYPHFGIGVYPSFTHIDSRSTGKARW